MATYRKEKLHAFRPYRRVNILSRRRWRTDGSQRPSQMDPYADFTST